MRVTREVAVELLCVARLGPVVELLADRARELVHERDRVDELECPDPLADELCRLVEELDVRFDLPRRVGPLHLDDYALSVRQDGPVHLSDRRGSYGLPV